MEFLGDESIRVRIDSEGNTEITLLLFDENNQIVYKEVDDFKVGEADYHVRDCW